MTENDKDLLRFIQYIVEKNDGKVKETDGIAEHLTEMKIKINDSTAVIVDTYDYRRWMKEHKA